MRRNRISLTLQLLTLLTAACRADEADARPTSCATQECGMAGDSANKDAGRLGAGDAMICPAEVPVVGAACQTGRMLCTYFRNGPCPPDADQLRKCIGGKWVLLKPAVACGPKDWERARADDAGSD
jgi:hypothetical protein